MQHPFFVAESFGKSSGIDQEAQRKEINENKKNCREKTSEDDDKSTIRSEDSQLTEVGEHAVGEGSFNQQREIKRAYDLADVVLSKRPLTDLTDEDKYRSTEEEYSQSGTHSCNHVILFALSCQCCSYGVYLQAPAIQRVL